MLYIADNLATLEYKLHEEAMTVIQQLSSIVSTCSQLASILEIAKLEGQPTDPISNVLINIGEVSDRIVLKLKPQDGDGMKADPVIHASIVVGLALLTKNHLLDLYGLAEE